MIDLPSSTLVHRKIPKKAFYEHLPLSSALKNKFVSDIDTITVENSLTERNLHLTEDSKVKEIMLLLIVLKKKNFDEKIIGAIAKQNPHKLIFLLECDDKYQFAVYYGKLYRTDWMKKENVNLLLSGNNLEEIWQNMIRQIAITSKSVLKDKDKPIRELLKKQDEINSLKIKTQKTEAAIRKEPQPKKKFEKHQKLQKYKKELQELTNGEY